MRRFPLFWTLLPLLAGCQGVASAQAMVENAMGASRAATSAAPMSGVTKSLEKTLKKGLPAAPASQPAVRVQTASVATIIMPAAPVVHYDDPKGIETGTAYDELVKRFGPASLEITTGPLTKTMSYAGSEGVYQVDLREGKVSSMVLASTLRR
jgi:hypothetical protein